MTAAHETRRIPGRPLGRSSPVVLLLELLCDPLHADDLESGHAARWSAAGP